eukprot:828715-Prorocentrum_minimum.AAC.1
MCCTTHPEDASGILHIKSGSEAYGHLDLTDKSPLLTPSSEPPHALPAGAGALHGNPMGLRELHCRLPPVRAQHQAADQSGEPPVPADQSGAS